MPKMNFVVVSLQNKGFMRAPVHAAGIARGSGLSFCHYDMGLEETTEVQVPINLNTQTTVPPCTTQPLWKAKNPSENVVGQQERGCRPTQGVHGQGKLTAIGQNNGVSPTHLLFPGDSSVEI